MQTFTINFTEAQLQVLTAAIVEMPFKLASPLVSHINSEIQKQLDAKSKDAAPKAAKEAQKFTSIGIK